MDQRHPRSLRSLHLFAGAGGGLLADLLLGHRPVCAVELDPYCQQVLMQRQRDGVLPWFPVWGDCHTFDGHPWRGVVDVVSGGFPCQDISVAGTGAGIYGPRSRLWAEFARILGEVRPRYAFIENTAALAVRGLDVVLADLAALGMDARWCCLGADDVGAPHHRKRLWILATDPQRRELRQQPGGGRGPSGSCAPLAGDDGTAERAGWRLPQSDMGLLAHGLATGLGGPWATEPADVPRVATNIPQRVARLKALGNGWVPLCAAVAWTLLSSHARRLGGRRAGRGTAGAYAGGPVWADRR